MKTGKVFVDTPVLIYYVEKHHKYYDLVSLLLATFLSENVALKTSVLTAAEFGVVPRRHNRFDVLNQFKNTTNALFEVFGIDWQIAEISAILRSKYPSLKTIDALQIACAIQHKCDTFITNDKRLKSISEIRVELIDNYGSRL